MKATKICARAAALVGGDRDRRHGSKRENHANIAALWNAYLGGRLAPGGALRASDVALMMVLLKAARTKTGTFNPDDFVDGAGYFACAGEIAAAEAKERPR